MNRFSTLSTLSTLSALAVALSAGLAPTTSFAASDEAGMSAPLTVSTAVPATGRTRAEVIAEMQVAMARGELQAGHEWGVDVPPVQTASQKRRFAALAAPAASVAR